MTTLLISDLHLEAARPEIGAQFDAFLEREAVRSDALYILGDLFEYWIGDDDPDPYFAEMKKAIARVTAAGVPVFFMHGNRDFLVGQGFANETGVELLDDPTPVNLYGRTVLLSHGDALCTDDLAYQRVRAMTHDPAWQAAVLARSLEERRAIAREARTASEAYGSALDPVIADVNPAAVDSLLRAHGVTTLVHGHTHRPAVHEFLLDGAPATRIVLGDWFTQGSVLRWDADGPRLETLPRG